MTFRLGGRNGYLIGFIGDHSRCITAVGLFRSQTAEHVLETNRRRLAEYGGPKEVLADNGRQYTNWRGKTRFEQELEKDRVRHIRSRPHHPMTLGKIERAEPGGKNEHIERAVAMILEAKKRYSLPIRTPAGEMGLSVATLTRWRRRLRCAQAAVGKRGPKKVKPLNLNAVKEQIQGPEQSRKRSRGSGRLHRAYGATISRRHINAMVRQVRHETNRCRLAETYRVSWLRSNLAWAMDDC